MKSLCPMLLAVRFCELEVHVSIILCLLGKKLERVYNVSCI